MSRFIEAQAFDVRPAVCRAVLAGHLLRVIKGSEHDILSSSKRLDFFQQRTEREAEPRYDHRPALDAPHSVYPLLLAKLAEQVVNVECLGPVDQAADLHSPRLGLESGRQGRHVLFVGREFVEVIVTRDGSERGQAVAALVMVGFCFSGLGDRAVSG